MKLLEFARIIHEARFVHAHILCTRELEFNAIDNIHARLASSVFSYMSYHALLQPIPFHLKTSE